MERDFDVSVGKLRQLVMALIEVQRIRTVIREESTETRCQALAFLRNTIVEVGKGLPGQKLFSRLRGEEVDCLAETSDFAVEPIGASGWSGQHGLTRAFLLGGRTLALPWISFDITLVGRHVSVIRDGKVYHDNVEIPGLTGGALDGNESEPGPFFLQGDHHGVIRYRNITVSVPAN